MKKEYIYIIAALLILIFIDRIMNKLGLNKNTKQVTTESNAKELSTLEQWEPTYQDTVTFRKLPVSKVTELVKELRRAVRGLGTKENNLYSVFQSLYNKANISQLAYTYYTEYKRNLKNDVLNELTKKEKAYLFEIINTLPDYE